MQISLIQIFIVPSIYEPFPIFTLVSVKLVNVSIQRAPHVTGGITASFSESILLHSLGEGKIKQVQPS